MNLLFNEYKEAGKITEALIVGKNMVSKNPEDAEGVTAYIELLLSLAEKLPSLEERKNFVGQANLILSFYGEHAEITKEVIEKIFFYRERLGNVAVEIDKIERKMESDELQRIESDNAKQIKQLYSIKQKLLVVKSQKEFDETLQELSIVDSKIEHEFLTDEQTVHYDQLNRECTETISEKMRQLEHISNVEYNRKAVEAYDNAFRKFRNDEAKYRNQAQLFSLVSSTLFAYDAGKLFNETLIYYNHVYSYIFGKLDDTGKLALTKYSIECERKLR